MRSGFFILPQSNGGSARKINPENASPEVRAAIDAHLSEGYRLTNEKLTLLHNVTAFTALEAQSYALDREFQRLVGKRGGGFP